MRKIQKTFNTKINKQSTDIIDEQTINYYEINNDTLAITSDNKEAIKLQIKHWFDTGLREKYFNILYGNSLYPLIHKRETVLDEFDLNDFIDKLENDLDDIIVVDRNSSYSGVEESPSTGKVSFIITLSYIIRQTKQIDNIILER